MDATSTVAVLVAAAVLLLLVLHVWYAVGLSSVFAARGAETWRAWVPVVNEAEVFRLGGVDPVRAALLLVPGVSVYGLVLKATAANRLGAAVDRGAGTTALAIVLPPLWATLLAAADRPAADPATADRATDDRAADDRVTVDIVTADAVELAPADPLSGPIAAIPGAPAPGAFATGAPGSAAGRRRRSSLPDAEPPRIPQLPGPVDVLPAGASAVESGPPADAAIASGETGAAPAADAASGASAAALAVEAASAPAEAASVPASAPAEAASAPAEAASVAAPAPADAASTPGDAASIPAFAPADAPGGRAREVGVAAPAASAPAGGQPAPVTPAASARVGAEQSVPAPSSAVSPLERTLPPAPSAGDASSATAAQPSPMPPVAPEPIDEETRIAPLRSRRRGEWALTLPDGRALALTARTVVLGRKPTADDGVQAVAVPDDTRTVSKQHARLDWTVSGWTITDLDSTNGVTLLSDEGSAERLPSGGTAAVTPRFRLGDAVLEVRPAPRT